MKPGFLDANIILRVLIGDDAIVAEQWRLAFSSALDDTFIVTPLILAEVVWVALSFYKVDSVILVKELQKLIQLPAVRCEKEILIDTLDCMLKYKVDFADAYLAALSRMSGISVYSLDKDFHKIKGMELGGMTNNFS